MIGDYPNSFNGFLFADIVAKEATRIYRSRDVFFFVYDARTGQNRANDFFEFFYFKYICLVQYGNRPFEPHSGVHILLFKRLECPVFVFVILHKYIVPHFDVSSAVAVRVTGFRASPAGSMF